MIAEFSERKSNMLTKETIERVLEKALSTGGDFAEIFVEDTMRQNVGVLDGKLDTALNARVYGIGIRVLKGTKCVYGSTNNDDIHSLLQMAENLAFAIGTESKSSSVHVEKREFVSAHPVIYVPASVEIEKKINVVKTAYKAAKEYSSDISQVQSVSLEWDSRIQIANSDGLLAEDRRIYSRLAVMAVASCEGENQVGFEGPGRRMGFELYEKTVDPVLFARDAAKQAVTMLHAKECPSGKFQVAIENGFGGVIFHEACGHSLEATSVSKGNSEFCGKLGQMIANPKVTAIDDGTVPNEWGSIDIDDEGTPGRKNVLIENGVLKSYMIDNLGGRLMGMEPTGNSRRQDYSFAPTSRMTNTYIANGPDKNEDILKSMQNGLYAKKMGGGSVNPITGEFNFSVSEGYMVRNGEICEPVRGACLIGKGSEILKKIDMVGQNQSFCAGMCGSSSGMIPVNVGQPLIRVTDITVGGRG